MTCRYFHGAPTLHVVVKATGCSATDSRDCHAANNDNELPCTVVVVVVVVAGGELTDNDDNDLAPVRRPRIIAVDDSGPTPTDNAELPSDVGGQ